MARPQAPSMPTPEQTKQAVATVRALYPDARLKRVGPNGIEFDYPDEKQAAQNEWANKPFSAD